MYSKPKNNTFLSGKTRTKSLITARHGNTPALLLFPVDATSTSHRFIFAVIFNEVVFLFYLPHSSPLECRLWIFFLPNVSVHLFFYTDSVTCIQALKSGLRHSCALCRWFVVTYCNPLKRQRALLRTHTHTSDCSTIILFFAGVLKKGVGVRFHSLMIPLFILCKLMNVQLNQHSQRHYWPIF